MNKIIIILIIDIKLKFSIKLIVKEDESFYQKLEKLNKFINQINLNIFF